MGFFYAVAKGHQVGVFNTWDECREQVLNFKGARYKKFKTEPEALEFITQNGGSLPKSGSSCVTMGNRIPRVIASSVTPMSEYFPNNLNLDFHVRGCEQGHVLNHFRSCQASKGSGLPSERSHIERGRVCSSFYRRSLLGQWVSAWKSWCRGLVGRQSSFKFVRACKR